MLPSLEVSGRFSTAKEALTQLVADEAAHVRGFELLSAAEVRAVLDQEATKQLAGCDATSCLAELANALDADLIVSGRVEATADGASLISLSLVNARAIVVVNRVNVVWRGADDRVPDVVRTSAQRLLIDAENRKPGGLVVTGLVEGARVVVDGVERTNDNAHGGVRGLDVGVHEVNVDAPDKLPLTTWGIVESEKDIPVDGSLEDVPVPAVWLWLGGATAVVVGAAATGAALYFSGDGAVAVRATTPGVGVDAVEGLVK